MRLRRSREAPVEAPAYEAPTAYDAPTYDHGYEAPAQETAYEQPADEVPMFEPAAQAAPVYEPQAYVEQALRVVAEGFTAIKFDLDVPNPWKLDVYDRSIGRRGIGDCP